MDATLVMRLQAGCVTGRGVTTCGLRGEEQGVGIHYLSAAHSNVPQWRLRGKGTSNLSCRRFRPIHRKPRHAVCVSRRLEIAPLVVTDQTAVATIMEGQRIDKRPLASRRPGLQARCFRKHRLRTPFSPQSICPMSTGATATFQNTPRG